MADIVQFCPEITTYFCLLKLARTIHKTFTQILVYQFQPKNEIFIGLLNHIFRFNLGCLIIFVENFEIQDTVPERDMHTTNFCMFQKLYHQNSSGKMQFFME